MTNHLNSQNHAESSGDFSKIAESRLDSALGKSRNRSLSLSLSLRVISSHP